MKLLIKEVGLGDCDSCRVKTDNDALWTISSQKTNYNYDEKLDAFLYETNRIASSTQFFFKSEYVKENKRDMYLADDIWEALGEEWPRK